MTTTVAPRDGAAILESVVVGNDLSKLTSAERVIYYRELCASLGLNPLTRPFQYIELSGRLTLYATKDATEQLRKHPENAISITKLEKETVGDVYIVTAYAKNPAGREDVATGAVPLPTSRSSEAIANAMMKAETKAKRRVTLSICGLGALDESELESVNARPAFVDPDTGEITPPPVAPDVFVVPPIAAAALKAGIERDLLDLSADTPDEATERAALLGAIRQRELELRLSEKDAWGYARKYLGAAKAETVDLASLRDWLEALRHAR